MNENFSKLIALASEGDVTAQETVATAYFKGKDIGKDIDKALLYYKMAAENGSGLGNYQIGRAFETGTGAEYDLKIATSYYEKAVELGYENAAVKLKNICDLSKEPVTSQAFQLSSTQYVAPSVASFPSNQSPALKQKSKAVAVLLAFFFGILGIHNFYLGNIKKGIIQLVLTVTIVAAPAVAIWCFIEIIMLLSGGIPCDNKGVKLK